MNSLDILTISSHFFYKKYMRTRKENLYFNIGDYDIMDVTDATRCPLFPSSHVLSSHHATDVERKTFLFIVRKKTVP